ncbi:STIV orfB116 family protein [uncultured Clostridium sp.]|uniref:STIV orfB116 family protein n=1 Tax=uncultured Clostridium sp. TaxID=59620 RepID=UPI0028E45FF2|nr:DUF1874 domain-containing protein [uncultured Clostridium sp.]
MKFLSNVFSVQMLDLEAKRNLVITPLTLDEAKRELIIEPYKSVINHQETVNVLSELVGFKIQLNNEPIKLRPIDTLIVGQVIGNLNLPEGCTTLPEGAEIQFLKVQVKCNRMKIQ